MATSTPDALRRRIAAGQLDSVYLVLGDDERQKDEVAAAFEETVDEGLRAFNVDSFQGGETPLGAILDATRTLPMMAPRRVVIVRHAERALQPKREQAVAARDAEALDAFLAQPPDHASLVLLSIPLDERRATTRRLLQGATVVRCGRVETVADAQRWVRARVAAADKRMDSDAVRLLAERIGPKANRLRDEVERLLLYVGDAPAITAADVRSVAGPAAAYDHWAVTQAIERGDTAAALRALGLALDDGAAPYMVLGQLAWAARTKLPPARVPQGVEAAFGTDVALKSSAGAPRLLLERLVVRLCEEAGQAARRPSGRGGGLRRAP